MKNYNIFISLALSCWFSTALASEPTVQIIGTKTAEITTAQPAYIFKSGAASANKHILLQRVKLSAEANDHIVNELETLESATIPLVPLTPALALPVEANLGMNNVPVLDQGMHGACVTFATTAAIDAAYGKGDYISQLCNLTLGSYLEKISANSYPSGWDGSYPTTVMRQIKNYGIIPMSYQLSEGCGGLTGYPINDENNRGEAMSPEEFALHSENIMANMSTIDLLKLENSFSKNVIMQTVLTKIKQAIVNQHRVIISFLVDDRDGGVGAYGTYKVKNDSWVVTPKILFHSRANAINAGHAIIVIGYDDNAIITNGTKTHTGALVLRNSWGKSNGDAGNYYMSYDYFRTLAAEAIELSTNSQ